MSRFSNNMGNLRSIQKTLESLDLLNVQRIIDVSSIRTMIFLKLIKVINLWLSIIKYTINDNYYYLFNIENINSFIIDSKYNSHAIDSILLF